MQNLGKTNKGQPRFQIYPVVKCKNGRRSDCQCDRIRRRKLSGEVFEWWSDADEEKRRHDIAVEKYQKEYQKYEDNRTKLLDCIATNERI